MDRPVSHVSGVVITGIGLVTPLGPDRETSWARLCRGETATRWLSADDLPLAAEEGCPTGQSTRLAGAPASLVPPEQAPPGIDRVTLLALRAAEEAVDDAHLALEALDRDRVGCVVGTSKGGLRSFTEFWTRERQKSGSRTGATDDAEALWRQFLPNAPATAVAGAFRLRGPCVCPVAACATGLACLERGAHLIRDGVCDVVLAGSSDASLHAAVLASFRRLGVLARRFDDPRRACRPFDRRRDGFVVGEGAAVVVMERSDHAAARGVSCYAQWLADGNLADAAGLTQLEPDAAALTRLIRDVLFRAELRVTELEYVNLHGTATRQNDLYETRAVKAAFGEAAAGVSCSGMKGALGHLLGAAGSVEAAFTLLALRDGIVPPTATLEALDPQCDLEYTPVRARVRPLSCALKLSLGFGGHLLAAVVRRGDRPAVQPDQIESPIATQARHTSGTTRNC